MTVSVNFLSPGDQRSELLVLFRQLALLWKFDLRELTPERGDLERDDRIPLVVDLASGSRGYQEAISYYIEGNPARTLLFASQTVVLQPPLQALTGVRAVSWQAYTTDLTVQVLQDDVLFHKIKQTGRLLRFHQGTVGHLETEAATVLLSAAQSLRLVAKKGNCYTIALPIWQFGVVSFPPWLRLMENALFFVDGLPHLAPGPYVALRIDDVPVTGQSYLQHGYDDRLACWEIREMQGAHRLYGAKLEYMLSSQVITAQGDIRPAPDVAPQAWGLLRQLYQRGELNIGAHGSIHLDLEAWQRHRQIIPQEFRSLGPEATRDRLASVQQCLAHYFGKERPGFVAPAWGYHPGVTKPAAADLFSYIADSNQHLQQADGDDLFGSWHCGCVSLYETWRSGMSGLKIADPEIFRAYLDVSIPIHLMLHGPWQRDPLTRNGKIAILAGLSLVLVLGNLWLWDSGPWWGPAALLLQALGGLLTYIYRRRLGFWLRCLLSRCGVGRSLQQIARAGHQAGAQWIFLEDLGHHMAAYQGLTLAATLPQDGVVQVTLKCNRPFSRSVAVHFPRTVREARVHPDLADLSIRDHVIYIRLLAKEIYTLTAVLQARRET